MPQEGLGGEGGRWRTQALGNRCPGFGGGHHGTSGGRRGVPPPQVSDLTRSVRAHPGRPSRLPGSSSRQMASQQVSPGPSVSDHLRERAVV